MLDVETVHLLLAGFLIAFFLAFGIGANDVANSFGTSVGSRVLTLKKACILATICEVSGAILLGSTVSDTIRSGIVNNSMYNSTLSHDDLLLMKSQLSALSGACIWLIVATFFKIPVSGTHSIVGATAGAGLVALGSSGIKWATIIKIVISWFASPVLSGIVSVILFFIIRKCILSKDTPLEPALYSLPFLYGLTVLVNVFSVLRSGLKVLRIPYPPMWTLVVASIGAGLLTGLMVVFIGIPLLRKRIIRRIERQKERELQGLDTNSLNSFNSHACTTKVLAFFTRFLNILRCKRSSKPDVSTRLELGSESPNHSNNPVPKVHDNPVDVAKNQWGKANSKAELLGTIQPSSNIEYHFHNGANGTVKNTDLVNQEDVLTVDATGDGEIDSDTVEVDIPEVIKDRPEEFHVFSFAQILTATFGSFAHGGNDVSNSIGPLVGLWFAATIDDAETTAPVPIWILLYGGVGISIGLWVWGRRVIETIGDDLTTITPSSGVCIEIGSALTVLLASNFGLPVSTTHCKVGSVVAVGRCRSNENVNWKLFLNIIVAWVVTLPVSGGISALLMYIFIRTG